MDPTGTRTTLHSFSSSSDGSHPLAGLVQATDGSFYGTTFGNFYGTTPGALAFGTVFRMNASGTITTLHVFNGSDGAYPASADLIQASDGAFYGMTNQGGAFDAGTVFRIEGSGALTTLYSFSSSSGYPNGRLVQGSTGDFYGTTSQGGPLGFGTVFKMDANGTLTTLHAFNGVDGLSPSSGLLLADDGAFYGTTYRTFDCCGGYGGGTIFKIDAGGTFTTLHTFASSPDGASPAAELIQASDGSFYGTTQQGGASNVGTVFRMDMSGTLTTLHSFGGSDGAYPTYARLLLASDGNLYGATYDGGGGAGVIFRLALVSYSFSGFYAPVDNGSTVNAVKAGAALPVRFSLGSNQGLNIFAPGYPRTQAVQCDSWALIEVIEETVNAGSSSLSYNDATGRYTYIWKTDRSWVNTCRQLQVKLADGQVHTARFTFR